MANKNEKKPLFLIVGKSGSGKSTVVNAFCERYGYTSVESYTDRPKRSEDERGHIFLTPEEFDELEGFLAYTEFDGHRYGTTKDQVDNADFYIIDPAGVRFMREHYDEDRKLVEVLIDVDEPTLRNRMLARGDLIEKVNSRIEHDEIAFSAYVSDYVIFNYDSIDVAISNLKNIVDSSTNIGSDHPTDVSEFTNATDIRSKNDEELAEVFTSRVIVNNVLTDLWISVHVGVPFETKEQAIAEELKWLKQKKE